MMLGARTGAWKQSGAQIPYLRRVEYLESDGNQYIKCYAPDIVHNIFITLMSVSYVRFGNFFGKYDHCLFRRSSSTLQWNFIDYLTNFAEGEKYTIGSLEMNERADTPMFIFGGANIEGPYAEVSKPVKARIFNVSSDQFNFIPVLDLSGRPAMYDEVSGQFFYNQGTGEFTWGEL